MIFESVNHRRPLRNSASSRVCVRYQIIAKDKQATNQRRYSVTGYSLQDVSH